MSTTRDTLEYKEVLHSGLPSFYRLASFDGSHTKGLQKTPRQQTAKGLSGKRWDEWREAAGRVSGTSQN